MVKAPAKMALIPDSARAHTAEDPLPLETNSVKMRVLIALCVLALAAAFVPVSTRTGSRT